MPDYALTWGAPPSQDDKLWALVAHLSPFVSTFIGPLILLLLFQDKSKFIRYHATQALVYQGALWLLGVVFMVISTLTCGLGSILYLLMIPLWLVPLYGAYLAWSGEWKGFPTLADIGK